MNAELIERRGELLARADALLKLIDSGDAVSASESEDIDFKEEAGRRGRNGELQPGEETNSQAATKLADEVCCLANTPGGGALVLGIEDKNKEVLGTELDAEWLRAQIYNRVDVAPAIEVRRVLGQRVLLILVAESPEPVLDTGGRIRWRVGDNCVAADRSEWWIRREASGGLDFMARATGSTVADVKAGALAEIQKSLFVDGGLDIQPDVTETELLRFVGAVRSTDHLTQAAKLLLCPAGKPLITLTVLDVHGGNVVNNYEGERSKSLLEQLSDVEARLDTLNQSTTVPEGFVEHQVKDIPRRAVREAILNGLIHRDWTSALPTDITWFSLDSTMVVKSPGGFTGGITPANLLTNRHARYPALADLFRALGMVDKQGVGVDRMYQSMITLGHRPPHIIEAVGPHVVCTLVGGRPVVPMLELVKAIRPEARQGDVRVAIILDALLHGPFLTLAGAAMILQVDEVTAAVSLRAATSCTIGDGPLVASYKGVWVLGAQALVRAKKARLNIDGSQFLDYATTDREVAARTVAAWLAEHDHITSSDLAEVSGISRPTASQILKDLDGDLVHRIGAGRAVKFVATLP